MSWRPGKAQSHGDLHDELVHVFVDDQNLFWGAVNEFGDHQYRVDFGELLNVVSKDPSGVSRGVKTAFIAGVIPDDDSFWQIAENQGFEVRRGYIGSGGQSKQDDAHLIAEMMEVLYEQKGPSTILLVAGDGDYGPPLTKALKKGWRIELAFHKRGLSAALEPLAHEILELNPDDFDLRNRW